MRVGPISETATKWNHFGATIILPFVIALAIVAAPSTLRAEPAKCNLPPKILVLRGLCEVFSLGMDDLKTKLVACGYDAKVTSWSLALLEIDRCEDRPVVVVGHSLGGRMCAWVSRKLKSCGRRVPLIIIVDANLIQKIPSNVDKCVHLYVTNQFGIFHGSPVRAESPLTEIVNWDVSQGQPSCLLGGVNHFDIDSTSWVHQIIINEIASAFPLPMHGHGWIDEFPCHAGGVVFPPCGGAACTRQCLQSCSKPLASFRGSHCGCGDCSTGK